jgi:hypothetical protein
MLALLSVIAVTVGLTSAPLAAPAVPRTHSCPNYTDSEGFRAQLRCLSRVIAIAAGEAVASGGAEAPTALEPATYGLGSHCFARRGRAGAACRCNPAPVAEGLLHHVEHRAAISGNVV